MSGGAARLRQVAWTRDETRGTVVAPGLMGGAAAGMKKGVQRSDGTAAVREPVQVPVSSLAFYRRYTELLLRRYMQVSLRMGRVPSVLGNCMFRGKVSSYRVQSFEDAVIFVYDVERCMRQLSAEDKELVARIALQEYTQAEAAELTQQSLRTVVRKYGEAIDRLTRVFLEKELLEVGPLFSGQ